MSPNTMLNQKHNVQGRISGFDDSNTALSPINMSVISPTNMFDRGVPAMMNNSNQDLDSVLDKMSQSTNHVRSSKLTSKLTKDTVKLGLKIEANF